MKTFPIGGIHPSDNKQWSKDCAIERLALPDQVAIPMIQHIGAPSVPIVAKGDKVLTGQLIAQAAGFVSANIHSPISGTVTAVDIFPNGQGLRRQMIIIKREGDEWAEGIDRTEELKRECLLTPGEIIAKVKDAGIVGMGGATFPTHVKLTVPEGQKAEVLIINGVECEPYLTSDYRTMLERGEELLTGVEILMRALSVKRAVIGVENNKPDAVAHLRDLVARGNYAGVEVMPLKTRYPQGGEKQLIAAVTGRQVPPPPALPISVGAVVCNVSTAIAIYEAVQKNKPLIERVVTVTGKELSCIKCAKCVSACPMGLEPYLLSKLAKMQKWDMAEAHNVVECIECGCCSYTCPSYLPLLDYIRIGKQTVMTNIRARAAANKK